MSRIMPKEEFLKKLYIKNLAYREGKFEVIDILRGVPKKVTVLVSTPYGDCKPSRSDLLRGNGPSIKSAINKTEYCIKQFKEKHGDKYDYSLVEYVSQKSKVKIICPLHGIFEQVPDTHKKGEGGIGCKSCGITRKTQTPEEIIDRLERDNFDGSTFELVSSWGVRSVIKVTCKIGHEYTIEANSRISGRSGCLDCHREYLYISNNFKREEVDKVVCSFYIIELRRGKELPFYKVGISKNIENRVKDIQKESGCRIKVLYRYQTSLREAMDKEQSYLKEYKDFRYTPPFNFGGRTECFSENPLNLDNWQHQHYLNNNNYEQQF